MRLDFLSLSQTRWLNGVFLAFPRKKKVAFCRLQKAFHEYTHPHCNCSTERLWVSTVLSPAGFPPFFWDRGLQALLHPTAGWRSYGEFLAVNRSCTISKPWFAKASDPRCWGPWSRRVACSSPAWWLHHCHWFRRANFPTLCLKKGERKVVFLNTERKLVLKIATERNYCLPCSSVCHCCTKPNEKLESRISSAPGACAAGNTACFRLLHHALLSGRTGQQIRAIHRHTGTFWCVFCWLWTFKQFF